MLIQNYKDLIVWQKSMFLTELIYDLTENFPRREWYGLAAQMRKSAVSIPSNVAEGRRSTRKDFRNFILIAYGSGSELETQLEIARRKTLGNVTLIAECASVLDELMRLLNKLQKSLYTQFDQ